MYKYIAAFIAAVGLSGCLTPAPALADRVDVVEAMPPSDYCHVVVMQFANGADGQANGFARKLSDATSIIELVEHNFPLPKESMWVMHWNILNDREKAWMEKNVFDGWDKAKEVFEVAKNNGVAIPMEPQMLCLNDLDPTSCGYVPLWLATITEQKKAQCMIERASKVLEKRVKSEHMNNPERVRKEYYSSRG